MKEGDYLLINDFKPAFSSSNRTIKVIVKLGCEYIANTDHLSIQPKWWAMTLIYADSGIYNEQDKYCICIHHLDHLDYRVIPEEEALAMAI